MSCSRQGRQNFYLFAAVAVLALLSTPTAGQEDDDWPQGHLNPVVVNGGGENGGGSPPKECKGCGNCQQKTFFFYCTNYCIQNCPGDDSKTTTESPEQKLARTIFAGEGICCSQFGGHKAVGRRPKEKKISARRKSSKSKSRPTPTTTTPKSKPKKKAEAKVRCPQPPSYKPCVSVAEADRRMHSCCVKNNVHAGCMRHCNSRFTKASLTEAFLSPACPNVGLGTIMACGAEGKDHTGCCAQLGVPALCHIFCVPNRLNVNFKPGLQHLQCTDHVNKYRRCFHGAMNP